jgi:uncharacterized protein (TIGR00297 family)
MKAVYAVPATFALCYRAWSHKSLTPAGIVFAALTATAHAVHPWNLPFVLLCAFFLAGTRVTKIKKDVKEKLTIQSSGNPGGEGPRTHVQVLANSGVASVLTLLHAYQLHQRSQLQGPFCYQWGGDLLVIGIVANYAAVAADTFSSELGILSSSMPRLITSPTLRKVPKGTNGGVTLWGLIAGLMGSMIMVTVAMLFVPYCGVSKPGSLAGTANNGLAGGHGWGLSERQYFAWGLVIWGGLGSVLDSFLGGWLQQSVRDTRSGRIVEGEGGKKVLVSRSGPNSMHLKKEAELRAALLHGDGKDAIPKPAEDISKTADIYEASKKNRKSSFGDGERTRVVESGFAVLDNNEVNFLMALTMSVGAMAITGWFWDVPLRTILPF